jgi:hypothetical protein
MERPMSGGEATALGFVIGFGVVAMMVGYFGLFTLYRRRSVLAPPTPPVRRIAPVANTAREVAPAPAPAAAVVPSEAPPTTSKPAAEPEPEPQRELAAPEPQLELPAPTAEEMSETAGAVATPAVERKPRRRRAPKVRPESPPEQNDGN